jgi:ABC-type nitrate/sulfonate/bicarbonate transport system permease component
MIRIRTSLTGLSLYMVSVAATVLIWHLFSTLIFNTKLMPAPLTVFASAWDMLASFELFEDIGASLKRILVGFALGASLGVVGGTLIGRLSLLEALVDPPLTVLRQIPPVAIIPLAIVWFGIGESSRYFVIFYGVLIVVLINTAAGVKATPEIRLRAAQCLGASRFRVFLTVVLPSALPYILTSMRLGLGFSFAAVVAAEIIAANSGIGYLIMQSRYLLQIDRMFVGLLVLGVLGAATDQLFQFAMRNTMTRFTTTTGR